MKLLTWYATGERGASSEAIARTSLCGSVQDGDGSSFPMDPSSLRRCLLLIEKVPNVRETGPARLAEQSPFWRALYQIWDELEEMLRTEIGDALPPHGCAPKTYDMMQEAFANSPDLVHGPCGHTWVKEVQGDR